MRFFSRLTILARGFTRRPRSRCRRSSSSTSSRDISRFPPYNPFACSPAISLSSPSLYRALSFSLSSLLLRIPVPLFPFRCFYFRHAFRRYRAMRTRAPPTHPPQPPRTMPQGVYSSNGARVEEPSDTIRWNGRSLDRSIHRANDTGID